MPSSELAALFALGLAFVGHERGEPVEVLLAVGGARRVRRRDVAPRPVVLDVGRPTLGCDAGEPEAEATLERRPVSVVDRQRRGFAAVGVLVDEHLAAQRVILERDELAGELGVLRTVEREAAPLLAPGVCEPVAPVLTEPGEVLEADVGSRGLEGATSLPSAGERLVGRPQVACPRRIERADGPLEEK